MTGAAPPIEWYLARDNRQYGPVSDIEMSKLVELRHLKAEDLVWRAGFADWTPAPVAFPQAFPLAAPPPPPAPPSPEPAPEPAAAPREPMAPDAYAAPPQPAHTPGLDHEAAGHHQAQPQAMAMPHHAPASIGPMAAEPAGEPSPVQIAEAAARVAQAAAAGKVETLAEYRARVAAGRIEPAVVIPSVSAPDASAVPGAAARGHASSAGGAPQRRMWIAPAEPDPEPQAQPQPEPPRAEPRLTPGPQLRDRLGGMQSGYAPGAGYAPGPGPSGAPGGFTIEPQTRAGHPDFAAAPAYGRPGDTMPAPRSPQGAPGAIQRHDAFEDEEDELEEDADRPRWGRRLAGLFAILVLLAAIGMGLWLALLNPDGLKQMMRAIGVDPARPAATATSGTATSPTRSVVAEPARPGKPMTWAQLTDFPETASAIDEKLQAGTLWQLVKAEFPEWYDERVREVQRLVSEKRPDDSVTKHLVDALVALRRKNAEHAFQASLPQLRSVALAFRNNLELLSQHSHLACFALISSGEGTRGMIGLMREPKYGNALQTGLTAIFDAVAAGRRAPAGNLTPRRADYDVLTKELTGLGWTEADLSLFADAQQLARTPPEKVCKMVRDWFAAHLAIKDSDIQTRLLVESIRPVVAG